jgi:tetratricopeptide (TPR) repeat protein
MAQEHRDRLLAEANAAYRSLHAADAVRLFREYLSLYPDRADVRVYLGAALLNLDQFQAALDEANRAIALNARYAKGYMLAGRVCSALEQWDAAQRFFETAQRLDPRDLDAWYFSGRAFYAANRFEPAVTAFERALREGAQQSRVYENLGLAQDALGQYDAAEKSFRKAVDLAGGASRPYLAYGAFLFRQRRAPESSALLRQALSLAPSDAGIRFELARVLYHENSLLARIYSARGETKSAESEIRAIGSCKPAQEHP